MIKLRQIMMSFCLLLVLAGCQQGPSEEYVLQIEAIDNLTNQNKFEEAIALAKETLELDNQQPDVFVQLGFLYLTTGEYELAEEALNNAFEREALFKSDEIKYKAYYNMGSIKYLKNNYSEAKDYLLRAVDVNPTDSELYNAIGLCFAALKDYEQAESYYMNALEYDDTNYNTYGNLAYVFLMKKDYNRALTEINTALFHNSKVPQFYLIRADILDNLGLVEEGIRNYSEALAIFETFSEAYYGRGSLYFAQQEFLKAISDYSFAKDYGIYEGYLGMGHYYYGLGQYDDAINAYNEYLGYLESVDLEALYWIGLCYYQMESYDETVQVYEEFLSIQPEDTEVMLVLSYAYMEQNHYDKARAKLAEILELDPNHEKANEEMNFLNEHELGSDFSYQSNAIPNRNGLY